MFIFENISWRLNMYMYTFIVFIKLFLILVYDGLTRFRFFVKIKKVKTFKSSRIYLYLYIHIHNIHINPSIIILTIVLTKIYTIILIKNSQWELETGKTKIRNGRVFYTYPS